MMALAMMSLDKVLSGYNGIRVDAETLSDAPLQPLLSYFEKEWLVDLHLWNVSTTDARTNNSCEGKSKTESVFGTSSSLFFKGYHNRMNHRITHNHPNIWQFIKFMQSEEKQIQRIVLQWSTGASKKKNLRTTATQKRIDTLYQRHNDGLIDLINLLIGLSFLVGNKK